MSGFTFNTAKSILCEAGAVARLGAIAREQIGQRIQIVTDAGVVAAGLLEPVERALSEAGLDLVVFDAVVADPPAEVVQCACEQARNARVDGIIGLGGGSSMDVAKLVALLVGGGESLDDIYGVGIARGKRLPLIQIPTTAGTGSEVTAVSIITVGESEKKGVVAPQLLPDLTLLDAELTLGLPPHVTAATGIDAMVHAIEAYTSKSPNNNPISSILARQALQLLNANIEKAVHQGGDIAARSAMLLGAMLAGQAFANSPVAAVHALAYPIGGIFHVPHGLSNALVLPHVMRFNAAACESAYAELAVDLLPQAASASSAGRAQLLIEHLAGLCRTLGLQTRLRELGIAQSDLPRMAVDAMKQTRLLVNNPREVDQASALAIYEQAW
ncbi:Alcohol dehydrogenase [Marinobacterium lacunae]|uniref:Alcohol dehydrogenase n=1 Tax=Marinobacterium lacunae TaxID=1232683 RepID=A0A081G1U7_9GAMM|nr:iron-containing alcohol dehydrogenase [Marinobacterium lacunae]KEA64752.1 Alcohol dehydrogenase [Marinobacterium lacunae]MBR9883254.1 iron-containing alcohol dehydrogenase [Oceanospirillales bacterium]